MAKRRIGLAVLSLFLCVSLLAATPASSVLAFEAPPAAATSSPSSATAVGGTVWAWGSKGATGLGDGTIGDKKTPVQVKGLTEVTAIAAGRLHALAVKSDGTVWAWGLNSRGQLGDGTTTSKYVPGQVSALTGIFTSVAAGDDYSLALRSDGTVWAWGANGAGQLGNNSFADSVLPFQVSGLSNIVEIAAANKDSLALGSDGRVWTWGFGQTPAEQLISNNPTFTPRIPIQVIGLTGVASIAAGDNLWLALKTDKTAWSWGAGGLLGDGTLSFRKTPGQVSVLTGVTSLAAGNSHNLAVKSDGTVWGWGINSYGQLGINASGSVLTAIPVPALTGVKSVAVGLGHSVALMSDGTVQSWGYNYYGQLGNNTTTNSVASVPVNGLTGVVSIAARGNYNLVIKTDAALTAVTGTAPIAVAPPASALTPVTGTAPLAPATGTTPTPSTVSTTSSGTVLYTTPEKTPAPGAGGVFLISVMVEGPGYQSISSGDLSFTFDATALEMDSKITQGDLFGVSPLVVQNDYDNTKGTARIVAARASGSSAPSGAAAGGAISEAMDAANAAQSAKAGAAQGAASGAATGSTPSNSLASIKFRVKSTAKPGDYQVSVSKASLANSSGQDIPVSQIKNSTITIGGIKMGDLTGDGVVDYRDLGIFGGAYGTSSAQTNFNSKADLNGDGLVNFLDLAIFGANYGK